MGSCGAILFVVFIAAQSFEPLRERAAIAHIVIAGDPFGADAERLRAVHVLRQLGDPMGYDFMADNVRLAFLPSFRTSEPPLCERAPCYYGLTHDGRDQPRRGDEAVAAAILRTLDKPRGDPEMGAYARILISVLTDRVGNSGYPRARRLVTAELARRPSADRRRNLERLLAQLERE